MIWGLVSLLGRLASWLWVLWYIWVREPALERRIRELEKERARLLRERVESDARRLRSRARLIS